MAPLTQPCFDNLRALQTTAITTPLSARLGRDMALPCPKPPPVKTHKLQKRSANTTHNCRPKEVLYFSPILYELNTGDYGKIIPSPFHATQEFSHSANSNCHSSPILSPPHLYTSTCIVIRRAEASCSFICEKNSGGHTHSHSAAHHIRTSSVISTTFRHLAIVR